MQLMHSQVGNTSTMHLQSTFAKFNCINNAWSLVAMHARCKSEEQTDENSEMNAANTENASRRLFMIAQYSAVWPSILGVCRRSKNSAAERAAAQALTTGEAEKGVKSGAETISRMRDRTVVQFWTEFVDNLTADVENVSYEGGGSIALLLSWKVVAIMEAKETTGNEEIGARHLII